MYWSKRRKQLSQLFFVKSVKSFGCCSCFWTMDEKVVDFPCPDISRQFGTPFLFSAVQLIYLNLSEVKSMQIWLVLFSEKFCKLSSIFNQCNWHLIGYNNSQLILRFEIVTSGPHVNLQSDLLDKYLTLKGMRKKLGSIH